MQEYMPKLFLVWSDVLPKMIYSKATTTKKVDIVGKRLNNEAMFAFF